MKILKKLALIIGILAIIGIWDIIDRNQLFTEPIPKDISANSYNYKTEEEHKSTFEKFFGNKKYSFPRERVEKIKLFKNVFLFSRLTSLTIDDSNKNELVEFFNNPDNFNYSETTWSLSESEYILRFYNNENKVIGKVWLCLEGCGMTESKPFSPNMKYGHLSDTGKVKISDMLDKILNN